MIDYQQCSNGGIIYAVACSLQRERRETTQIYGQANYEFMVDVLESYGDEGRGKLRKAWGRSTHPLIPRLPNGVTRLEFV